MKLILVLILASIQLSAGNLCVSKSNCKECVTASDSCGWCLQKDFTDPESKRRIEAARCDYMENIEKYCDPAFIFNPSNEQQIVKDDTFKPLDSEGLAVQIKPQQINVKLRPHVPHRFKISYQLAEDYPVDLYFLMDLSNSMDEHKKKLSKLGQTLANNMRNITKNFRLGFGSFVEKETLPFVNTAPRTLTNPCLSVDKNGVGQCVEPYGYQHHMTLTDNSTLFESEVRSAKVSGNLDSPEGGLDALMQAIVCEQEVGWRKASRKLIVFSTDAGFHFAGDGKLAGIIEPNDGTCHMDKSTRRYTHGLLQDYPSIGEINSKISENNVNLIFAVVRDQASLYKKLSEMIEGSFVGELDDESSNIVQLVVDIYKTIAKKILFATEALPEGVSLKFFSKCQNDTLLETSFCDGLRIKERVDFEVELTLNECPSERLKPIVINAQGLGERVVVNVEPICECDCSKEKDVEPVSDMCNNKGKIVCGICECDPLYYGNKCECSKSENDLESGKASSSGNISSCINPNQDFLDGPKSICSNQGRCNCGQCQCNDPSRISGKFCECDNESCDRYLSVVCAGNGRCECGTCKCNEGWTKSDCSCSTNTSSCVASNGLICNGYGKCVCGKCVCDANSGYFGLQCEDCPTCPLPCEKNRDCVQCKAFGTGKFADPNICSAECEGKMVLSKVPEVNSDDMNKKCQFIDSTDNCTFIFSYSILNDKLIKYQATKECHKSFPTWAIIAIIVSSVLFAGFAILITWKILDTMQQKRECARFNEEKKKAAWEMSENPLYKSATSRFVNPSYKDSKATN